MLKFLVLPGVEAKSNMLVNPFVPNAPFLYLLKRCTGNEWAKKLSKNMKKTDSTRKLQFFILQFNNSFLKRNNIFFRFIWLPFQSISYDHEMHVISFLRQFDNLTNLSPIILTALLFLIYLKFQFLDVIRDVKYLLLL